MSHQFPLGREAIEAIIPHRDPMLFVESVVHADETSLEARTHIDPNWPIFQGHFPELPIMPGVLLIETIAQGGALILGLKGAIGEGEFAGLSGVEIAKFRRAVKPGDIIDIRVELLRERRGFFKFEGRIDVSGERAVDVKFAAAQMSL